ncbi:hypothetical protein [Paenibacillus sp. AGC30]
MDSKKKKVCLLVNLGGFERRMSENLQMAKALGYTVYALTGDGLVDVDVVPLVPVNVMELSTAELFIWSSLINEQLQGSGFHREDMVLFAAGRSYRGILPVGTTIGQGFRIGA